MAFFLPVKKKGVLTLFLGPEVVRQTAEMCEIEALIGGRERLIKHIKVHPDLYTAGGIFALRQVGCLNPVNFARLTDCQTSSEFLRITFVITELLDLNLLNQANFELAVAHKEHASPLFKGILNLKIAGLITQASFEELVRNGKNAETVGSAWRRLKEHNLLNATNRQMVVELAEMRIGILWVNAHCKLEDQHHITPNDGQALQWTGGDRKELNELSQRIDDMFAYGLFLLSGDEEKALTVFVLALNLKKSLKTFFEKPIEEQVAQQQQFKVEFKRLLHSQDRELIKHRAFWKVIVANIAIAFTGVGLFALGAYYLATGHCFFHQTQRENLRDAIEESTWLQDEKLAEREDSTISCAV